MAQYDNTNSGILARNENRKTDKHPEFTGTLNVDGREYWLSAWVNTGKPGGKMDGKRYFSIKVSPKETKARPSLDDGYDDNLPF